MAAGLDATVRVAGLVVSSFKVMVTPSRTSVSTLEALVKARPFSVNAASSAAADWVGGWC